MTGRTCIIFTVPQDIPERATIPSCEISPRKNFTRWILVVVHRLLRFSSMKLLLLPPEVLSVAVLILSFVARLSLSTKTDPCHLLHIPATVRSLKTKTFLTLHCPNEVLLLPEILLRHDQIFSFLLDSIKSILDHYKGVRKTFKAWIQINRTNSHLGNCTKGLMHIWKVSKLQNKTHGIVGRPV